MQVLRNKMSITKKSFLAASIWVLLFPCFLSPASTDIFGYFENRFFLVEYPKIAWDNLEDKFKLGDYNRLRLHLKASPAQKVTVNMAVDFFSFHGILTSPLGTYGGADNSALVNSVKIDLDRAYVDLHFKKFDLAVGKQRLALGVSYLWTPLDVFNRINILEPKEEKPGTNAFKIYIPLSALSSITGIFSPANNFAESKTGFRAQTQALGIDTALTLIRLGAEQTSVYGVDFRGENFIGWWIESGYFVSPQRRDVKLVLGFDYTFPVKKGLYWLNEFFYDASGEADPANYDYQKLIDGRRFTLGRKYFLSMLRYGFSDFISAYIVYIANWGDGSYILNPALHYEISQDAQVSLGFYFPLGHRNGEFKKDRPNIFFLWLKINF